MNIKEKKVDEIIFREDLYPRFNPRQDLIERYAASLEFLPPIKINQGNILIDGFHRWKAHQLEEKKLINIELIETKSEKELKKLAYQYNSNHGLQLEPEEKKRYAQEMIGEMSSEELKSILSVDDATIFRWTKSQREAIKEERNRRIIEMYLRAWNTQQGIADVLGVTQQSISNVIESTKKLQMQEICKDFKPYLYNIWNLAKMDTETSHFGAFPQIFMENLLYYHTKPLDIIYDPFAGNGTTVDACKKWFRRYYCSDLKVKPGREKDIKEWDIANGLPDDLPKPDFIFIDPPYWCLANKEYSDDKNDLGNVTYEEFINEIKNLFDLLKKKKVKKIAYVIKPIWDTSENEWNWIDPTEDFFLMLCDKYKTETWYELPYSTQQYSGLWVDRAKEKNKCLITTRILKVMRLKNNG